ncbi:TBC1 domain, member 5 [Mortierella polycephala]|uniref:TBC1 domain, member 5 n=1 Tax=Mortierella polycephala TaxID=41804 RepID=A0A9P6U3E9_9FUNG|nr:TBC1 domain, member 5 [Mortierella polycephala]
MNTLKGARKKWAEVFEDPNLTQVSIRDRAISQHSNLGVDGIRSVCWKIYLSCLPTLEISNWSFAMNKERERYVALRQKYIRAIGGDDGAEPDLEVNNPLSLAEDSPWQQFFVDSELRKIIKQDVERTLPDIDYFRSERVQEQLCDILFIYCKINHDVSYRQGMHELVAHILWVVSSESLDVLAEPGVSSDAISDVMKNVLDSTYVEHDTFILFSSLMNQAKPWYEFSDEGFSGRKSKPNANHDTQLFGGSKAPEPPAVKQTPVIEWSLKIFHHLERVDNELYLHLMSLEIQPQLFGIRWFRLLFSREFPMDDVLKIWDGIFAKDPSLNICIFIGVALLLRIRDELLEEDFSGCLHKLMRYPTVKDIHLFIPQALHLQKTSNTAGGLEIIRQNNILTGKPLPELPPSVAETGHEGQRQHHHRHYDGAVHNQNQVQSSHHQHHQHHQHHHHYHNHNQQSHNQDQIKGLSSSFPGNGVLSQHLPPAALDAIKPVAEGFVHVTKNMLESKGGAALNKAIHDMKKNTQSYIRKATPPTTPTSTPSFPPMFDQAISSSGKLVASSRPALPPQHHTAHGLDKHIQSQLGQIVAKALVILESEFTSSSKGAQEGADSEDVSKLTEASPSKSQSKAALAAISGLEHVRDILLGFSKEIDPLVIESGMLENPDSAAGANIAASTRPDVAHTGPKLTQAAAKQSTHRPAVMSAPINVVSPRGSSKAFAQASRGASPARSSIDGLGERRSVSRTSSQVSGIIGGNGHEYGFGTSSTLPAQASSPVGSEPSIYAPAPIPPVTPKPFSFDDLIEGTESTRSSSPSPSPGIRAGSAGLTSKVKSPRSSLANSQFSWMLNDSADKGSSAAGLKSAAGGSQPFLSPLPSPSLPKAGSMAGSPSESQHLKIDPLAGSVSRRSGSGQSTPKAVLGLSTTTVPINHQLQEDDPLRT